MNIIKAILLFFVGLFSIPPKLNAQNFNPKDYTSFHKQIVFEDNFDNDKNKWIDKDDTTDDGKIDTAFVESKETKIANGYLKHDNRSRSKIYAAGIETNIDFNKNFEMEISALIFFSFKPNHPSAITFWGRDSAYDCNYFYYDEDNYFIFTDCKIQSDCKSKSKHGNAFIKNDFNKITIRHYNDSYYIFINEKFQKSFPFRPLVGHKIGLGAGIQCTMVYDYAKISYID